MPLQVETVPGPQWTRLPDERCHNVYVKSLLRLDHLGIAMLRFDEHATIHEHDAPMTIDVICLEGAGFVSVGAEQGPLHAGERVHWPAGELHRLWTDGEPMLTLMIEYYRPTLEHPFTLRTL